MDELHLVLISISRATSVCAPSSDTVGRGFRLLRAGNLRQVLSWNTFWKARHQFRQIMRQASAETCLITRSNSMSKIWSTCIAQVSHSSA